MNCPNSKIELGDEKNKNSAVYRTVESIAGTFAKAMVKRMSRKLLTYGMLIWVILLQEKGVSQG